MERIIFDYRKLGLRRSRKIIRSELQGHPYFSKGEIDFNHISCTDEVLVVSKSRMHQPIIWKFEDYDVRQLLPDRNSKNLEFRLSSDIKKAFYNALDPEISDIYLQNLSNLSVEKFDGEDFIKVTFLISRKLPPIRERGFGREIYFYGSEVPTTRPDEIPLIREGYSGEIPSTKQLSAIKRGRYSGGYYEWKVYEKGEITFEATPIESFRFTIKILKRALSKRKGLKYFLGIQRMISHADRRNGVCVHEDLYFDQGEPSKFYINENLKLRQEILKLETLISELRDRILNPDPPDTSHSFSAEGIEIMKLDLDRAEKDLEELKARYLEKNYDLPNE